MKLQKSGNNISRRNVLKYGKFALATGAVTVAISCQSTTNQQPEAAPTITPQTEISSDMSPDKILEELMAGNQRFIENKRTNPNQTQVRLKQVAAGQNPFISILSCADSRVPVEIIFDRGLGDVFVVRDAGNIATPEEIGSLEFGTLVLGSKVLMVLGHESCGAVKATIDGKAVPGQIGSIIEAIKPAVESAKDKPGDPLENAVKANVILQMERLKASPVISQLIQEGKLKVVGGYYDLDTGKVSLIS